MRTRFLAFAFPLTLGLCDNSTTTTSTSDAPPKPTVTADTVETVQRVDMGGRYRGPGVVVTPTGYVVTALENLPEYVFWKYRVTIGSDRLPGTIVAVDESLGLALIRVERPLRKWAVFTSRIDLKSGNPVVAVGFLDSDSEPQMIVRIQVPALVDDVHLRGESVGRLDLHDMTTVSLGPVDGRLHTNGSAVFSPAPDGFIGIVVGSSMHAFGQTTPTTPLFVVPSSSIATFMRAHGAVPKMQ